MYPSSIRGILCGWWVDPIYRSRRIRSTLQQSAFGLTSCPASYRYARLLCLHENANWSHLPVASGTHCVDYCIRCILVRCIVRAPSSIHVHRVRCVENNPRMNTYLSSNSSFLPRTLSKIVHPTCVCYFHPCSKPPPLLIIVRR